MCRMTNFSCIRNLCDFIIVLLYNLYSHQYNAEVLHKLLLSIVYCVLYCVYSTVLYCCFGVIKDNNSQLVRYCNRCKQTCNLARTDLAY